MMVDEGDLGMLLVVSGLLFCMAGVGVELG